MTEKSKFDIGKIAEENKPSINCSVTVMPVYDGEDDIYFGFIRRAPTDTFPNMLVAPGGKVEKSDGQLIDGVMYYAVEHAAARELREETGIDVGADSFFYACSLVLQNGRTVISLWTWVNTTERLASKNYNVSWLTKEEIENRNDFAPGMKQEALVLFEKL